MTTSTRLRCRGGVEGQGCCVYQWRAGGFAGAAEVVMRGRRRLRRRCGMRARWGRSRYRRRSRWTLDGRGWRAALRSRGCGWLSAPDADAVAAKHPALADDHGAMFSATFNPAQAEKLFAGTGHTFAEMLALADAQKPLPRFALGKSVTATVVGETSHVVSPNIVARA